MRTPVLLDLERDLDLERESDRPRESLSGEVEAAAATRDTSGEGIQRICG